MSLWSTGGLFSLQNEPRSWPPYFTTLSFCVWNLNTLRLDLQRHIGQKLQGIYGESDGCPIFVSVITRKSIIIMPKIGYFGIFRFPPTFWHCRGTLNLSESHSSIFYWVCYISIFYCSISLFEAVLFGEAVWTKMETQWISILCHVTWRATNSLFSQKNSKNGDLFHRSKNP